MGNWQGFLIGLLVGGTLGTIAMGLIASCRVSDDFDIKENTAKEYVLRK